MSLVPRTYWSRVWADLGEQAVANHLVADVDRRGEALGIGAAVALDDDAIETEEDAAVHLARIHLVAQRRERVARQQVAELGAPRPAHRALEQCRELTRRAFRDLDRDVAGKSFGDDDVDHALADVVALDEADILEIRQACLAQDAAGVAHLLQPLDLLHADVEEADRGPLEIEHDARHGAAHHRHVDDVLGIGTDRGAHVEHDRLAPQRRPQAGDRRPLDPRHGLEIELAPSPSRRRYCRRRSPHPPRPSSPHRWRATSTTSTGRRAAPGSAWRPS